MKVLLVNGSPHKNGCTHRALQEIQMQLKKEAIDSEIFWIGSTVQGCIGCCQCQESGTCVFDDILKIFLEKADFSPAILHKPQLSESPGQTAE